jgi:hypothetical protein
MNGFNIVLLVVFGLAYPVAMVASLILWHQGLVAEATFLLVVAIVSKLEFNGVKEELKEE